jgi:hypothetical protein
MLLQRNTSLCDSTYVSTLDLKTGGFPRTPTCLRQVVKTQDLLVADIERFTVMITHSVLAQASNFISGSTDMLGSLIDAQGRVVKYFTDQSRPGDIMSVQELMMAAGVSLEGTLLI